MELERFTPGAEGEIWYEHWHRYHFVAPLAAGRRVLDIASGEGYGSALLATAAASVLGVDMDAAAVGQARRRYGAQPRLEFREGRCEAIPLPDASVDLVVSFETLEHIPDPARLMAEAARVLAPGGTVVVSTPNKAVYSDQPRYRNPFHVRELYRDEFFAMVRAHFSHAVHFGQRVDHYSAIWPLQERACEAQLLDARVAEAATPSEGIADPMYYVAVCGQGEAAVGALARRFSLLSDREHRLREAREQMQKHFGNLLAHVGRVEAAYAASQEQIAALAQERDRLAARLKQLEPPPARTGWPRK